MSDFKLGDLVVYVGDYDHPYISISKNQTYMVTEILPNNNRVFGLSDLNGNYIARYPYDTNDFVLLSSLEMKFKVFDSAGLHEMLEN